MDLSVVIPTFNEEKNVKELYSSLKKVLKKIKKKYEIIFVDDGSTDNTFSILKNISKRDRNLKIIKFRKNFGQSAAFSAGFKYSKGKVMITLDADLQNDPRDIPKLLKKINEGFDVVCGWRKNRKDSFLSKKLPSIISNWLARKITKLKIHDFGCSLRAYKRGVVKELKLYGEIHRYIPALAYFNGYTVTEIEVRHHTRKHGKSKYKPFRLFKGLSDLITIAFFSWFGDRPSHIFNSLGLIISSSGFILLIGLIIKDLIDPTFDLSNRTLLFISILIIFSGIQLVTTGLMSEMMTKIRYQLEEKQFYKISRIVKK